MRGKSGIKNRGVMLFFLIVWMASFFLGRCSRLTSRKLNSK